MPCTRQGFSSVRSVTSCCAAASCETGDDACGHAVEAQVRLLAAHAALVELGQADDIADQSDEALRLGVDVPGEVLHVLRLCDAVADELGKAGDGRQRRAQLVGRRSP